jgi:hypothetical protein
MDITKYILKLIYVWFKLKIIRFLQILYNINMLYLNNVSKNILKKNWKKGYKLRSNETPFLDEIQEWVNSI